MDMNSYVLKVVEKLSSRSLQIHSIRLVTYFLLKVSKFRILLFNNSYLFRRTNWGFTYDPFFLKLLQLDSFFASFYILICSLELFKACLCKTGRWNFEKLTSRANFLFYNDSYCEGLFATEKRGKCRNGIMTMWQQ